MADSARSDRLRRILSSAVFIAGLCGTAFAFRHEIASWFGGANPRGTGPVPSAAGSATTGPGSADELGAPDAIHHWTCSMHPSVRQKGPGKCPICGMELIPVTNAQEAQGVVMIDDARRQLIGVRTGPVVEGPMRQSFRAVGQVTYDESKLSDVNLKVQGWITKLFVNQTGQRVSAGQPLFSLYSPELYNAQQDLLLATRGASASASSASGATSRTDLGRAARQRLHLLGLTEGQITNIEKNASPTENVTISSPASGFVIEKNVVEGASVDPGMRLFRIAALNKVWVEADVYEGDLRHVHVGQVAKVTLDFLPGRLYEAKVSYIYPYLDPKNRTVRVRTELANKDLDLRPGMYATIELAADAEPRLQVPASAVVYTGPRRLVFLDLGEGRFRPQEIRVGSQAEGMYEVLDGLRAGDVVATSGVFLIAAEARIRTAAKYWDDTDAKPMPSAPMPDSPAPAGPVPRVPPEPMNTPTHTHAPSGAAGPMKTESGKPAPPAAVYTCPMHPEIRSPTPGKCPICGMDLVLVPGGGTK